MTKRGRQISVPAPHRTVSVILNNGAADKLDEIAKQLRDRYGRAWSTSALIHQLIEDAGTPLNISKRLGKVETLAAEARA